MGCGTRYDYDDYDYDDCPEAPVGYDPVPEELAAHLVYYAGQFGWSNRGELCLSYFQQDRNGISWGFPS